MHDGLLLREALKNDIRGREGPINGLLHFRARTLTYERDKKKPNKEGTQERNYTRWELRN